MALFKKSYIDQLRENLNFEMVNQSPATLTDEIREWWEGLSETNRFPAYSMRFFTNTFGYAPSKIGPALFGLGWSRQRSWQRNGPFRRTWVPPQKIK